MAKRHTDLGRVLAVSLAAGVLLALAGCGDARSSGTSYADADKIADRATNDTRLSRTEIISASYQAALDAGSAHMAMTMKGAAEMTAEGDLAYAAGSSAMQLTMSMPALGKGAIEMRHVDKKIYLQLPGLTPAGKFIAIDPSDQRSPMGKSFSGLTDQIDPLSAMKSMEAAVTEVDRVGESRLDGARVDHYRVQVDTTKLMKELRQPNPDGMPRSLSYDLWIDADDLIRKMSFDVSGAAVEMLLSDWGKPVSVERPSAGDIVAAPGA